MVRKKTHEEYLVDLKEKGITVYPLEQYNGNKVNILHKCDCGNEWAIKPYNVLAGRRCKQCKGTRISETLTTWTTDSYKEELLNRGIGVIPLEEYVHIDTKIKHRCTCGGEWFISPYKVLKGQECRPCSYEKSIKDRRISHEEYIKSLEEGGITARPLDKVKGLSNMIRFVCGCGNEFIKQPSSVLAGYEYCNECQGRSLCEYQIERYLSEEGFEFEVEKTFDGLIGSGGRKLRFDFAVYDGNGGLDFLIEYHGKQHFEPIEYFGGEEHFEIQQRHDKQKKEYCIRKGIRLIEIDYRENDVIMALESVLKKVA
jgi:hypothetical protein